MKRATGTGSHAFFILNGINAEFGESIGIEKVHMFCFFLDTLKIYNEAISIIMAMVTLCFSCYQYMKHKKRNRVEILCKFNERYQTEESIVNVTKFLEEIEDNELDQSNKKTLPSIHELEMYMRFYEELYFLIQAGSIKKKMAYYMFGHYVILFDDNKDKLPENLNYNDSYWVVFRTLVEIMRKSKKTTRNNHYMI